MQVAGARVRPATLAYVVLEDVLIVACLLGASAFANFGRITLFHSPLGLLNAVALLFGVKAFFFWTGLYDFRHRVSRRRFWTRLLAGLLLVSLAAVLLWCGVGDEPLACLTFLVAMVPAVIVSRLVYEYLSRSGRGRRRLLFLGIGQEAQRTAREILDERSREWELVGFLVHDEEEQGWRIGGRPVLGRFDDLERIVREQRVQRVVVAVPDRRKMLPLEALLRIRLQGVEIVEEPHVHEEIAGKIPVEELRPSWLIFSHGFSMGRLRQLTKRVFDVVVAAVGLVLSSPIALLTALAIRLESPGPIIYRQKRVGQGGKEFTVYKFRSMRQDAEKGGKAIWAQENDPRATRVGKFIRKTRIDEIPQMWNVLQGTMSFVGPRPERLVFVEKLRREIPFYDQRHAVKPGITGWAQVRFRYGSDEDDAVEKLRHDMFYIKLHSILFDLRILLDTVRVVFDKNMGR
jgi:sugar transferase (PEP-CTERM system associated)